MSASPSPDTVDTPHKKPCVPPVIIVLPPKPTIPTDATAGGVVAGEGGAAAAAAAAAAYFVSPLYPAEQVWRMFTTLCGHDVRANREFVFFITGKPAPYRHNAFRTAEDFKARLKALRPYRVDLGGVYTSPLTDDPILPDKLELSARELAFDIDIDAYDNVRECGCSEQRFCRLCWPLVNTAVQFICHRLEALQLKQPFVFYSGNRGIHIRCLMSDEWLFYAPDKNVREATRRMVTLDPLLGGYAIGSVRERGVFTAIISTILPVSQTTADAYGCSGSVPFEDGFAGWYALNHPRHFIKSLMGSASTQVGAFASRAARLVSDATISSAQLIEREEFTTLRHHVISALHELTPQTCDTGETGAIVKAALATMLPRVDAGPTDDPGHLLRAPMGAHTTTGRIGVPIVDVAHFYPDDCAPKLCRLPSGQITLDRMDLADTARLTMEEWVSNMTMFP